MPKEETKFKVQLKDTNRSVDLKVANKKYAITFHRANTRNAAVLDPSILGVNDKSEIRIMVNAQDGNIDEVVEHIKSTFQQYIKEMASGEMEAKVFQDVICQEEDEDTMVESLITLTIEKDVIILENDTKTILPFASIHDIYVEKRSDLSQSGHDTNNHKMKYALQFENWIIMECDNTIYGLNASEVERLFMALSQAYFMAQMKQK